MTDPFEHTPGLRAIAEACEPRCPFLLAGGDPNWTPRDPVLAPRPATRLKYHGPHRPTLESRGSGVRGRPALLCEHGLTATQRHARVNACPCPGRVR